MKRILLTIAVILTFTICHAQLGEVCADSLRPADLLFVVNNKGNAITAVTEGTGQLPIDHVAIFYIDDKSHVPSVIHADYQGVRHSSLNTFLSERKTDSDTTSHFIVVGRVQAPFDVKQSLRNSFSHLGKAYDYYFLPDDSTIYCSELVQISYVDCDGKPLFSPIPMTFRDSNGKIPQYWVQHYKKKSIAIPEGEPGSNPGDLSRRNIVKILGKLVLCHKD